MIELPMVFIAGVLGTAHCAGMCGPLALMIGGTTGRWPAALLRQIAYTAGRVFTYGTLGAAAGFGGQRLVQTWPGLVNVPALLAVSAGGLLIYQGLLAAGFLRKRGVGGSATPCLSGGLLSHFLRRSGVSGVFLAGLFTGFLPCGLLYGMLALAMSTHSVLWGGLTMIVFGLGTAPAMMAIGLAGRLINVATRRRLLTAAAWCLAFAGVVSVARGISFISTGDKPVAGCPLCRQ
jgi:sulfite exporter TauE/SafE